MCRLFLKFQSVLEGFADALSNLVISMCIRIKSDSAYQGHVEFPVYHDTLICGHIYDFADHTDAVFVVLILDKLTLQAQGEFVDDGSLAVSA